MGGMAQAARVFGSNAELESRLSSLSAAVYEPAGSASARSAGAGEYRGDATLP
jgi:hypothetical protein